MAAEREVAEEKLIPRCARDDKDGKKAGAGNSTDVKVGHYKT